MLVIHMRVTNKVKVRFAGSEVLYLLRLYFFITLPSNHSIQNMKVLGYQFSSNITSEIYVNVTEKNFQNNRDTSRTRDI